MGSSPNSIKLKGRHLKSGISEKLRIIKELKQNKIFYLQLLHPLLSLEILAFVLYSMILKPLCLCQNKYKYEYEKFYNVICLKALE